MADVSAAGRRRWGGRCAAPGGGPRRPAAPSSLRASRPPAAATSRERRAGGGDARAVPAPRAAGTYARPPAPPCAAGMPRRARLPAPTAAARRRRRPPAPPQLPAELCGWGGRPVGWRPRRRGAPRPGQAWGPPSPVPAVPRPPASRLVTALQSPQPRFETPRRGLCRTPPSCSLTVPGCAARVTECRDAVCARRNARPRRGGVRSEPSQEDQSSVNMNKVDLENHIT
ncbi:uncharacterized protein LOC142050775 [Phalacrocorax aristotelis]|uniref:uncharacterized protein LOC142050775 n=1 Tax=Phalacrocorax aristotelis TaxID=126867 RepID=UPI003F4C3B6B